MESSQVGLICGFKKKNLQSTPNNLNPRQLELRANANQNRVRLKCAPLF